MVSNSPHMELTELLDLLQSARKAHSADSEYQQYAVPCPMAGPFEAWEDAVEPGVLLHRHLVGIGPEVIQGQCFRHSHHLLSSCCDTPATRRARPEGR